jgi:hypothetical protein
MIAPFGVFVAMRKQNLFGKISVCVIKPIMYFPGRSLTSKHSGFT